MASLARRLLSGFLDVAASEVASDDPPQHNAAGTFAVALGAAFIAGIALSKASQPMRVTVKGEGGAADHFGTICEALAVVYRRLDAIDARATKIAN